LFLQILFYYWSAATGSQTHVLFALSLKCACTRESIFWCRSTARLIDFIPLVAGFCDNSLVYFKFAKGRSSTLVYLLMMFWFNKKGARL
jgi:hypothetical protein